MARQCPPLTTLTKNPDFILIGNVGIPRLSTYQRSVNTKVDLTCISGFELDPNNPRLVCMDSLQWDKTTPVCIEPTVPSPTTPAPSSPLSDNETLIIAITGGIGGFLFIALIVFIALIWCILTRRKAQEVPPSPRAEVTSAAGTLYALDNRGFGHNIGYPMYPPSYSSGDFNRGKVSYGRNSVALPPPSFVHHAYTNRLYDQTAGSIPRSARSREYSYPERRHEDEGVTIGRSRDPQDYPETRIPDEVPRRRDEIRETLARERFDQLQHDRARSGDAMVKAERTLQYVEEHSSRSATPSFGGPRDVPGAHQGPAGYSGTGPTRYPDDYRTYDHIRGNLEHQRQQRYPDDRRITPDPRVADQDYDQYAGGPIGHSGDVFDSFDRTRMKTYYPDKRHL